MARCARVADQRRHCSRGAADHDVLCRRALQPARVDEDVEEVSCEREQRGRQVDQRIQQHERGRGERDPELERVLRGHAAGRDRPRRGPRAHQRVDVAIEVVVQGACSTAGKREADEHRDEDLWIRRASCADERSCAAGEEQQRHHLRLGQRHVVTPFAFGLGGVAAHHLCPGKRGRAERERCDHQVDVAPDQERRQAEEDEGRDRGRQELPCRHPGDRDESGEWRQSNRGKQSMRGAPAGGARDDGESRACDRGERGQPGPRADQDVACVEMCCQFHRSAPTGIV